MQNEVETSNGILDIVIPVIPESDIFSSIIFFVLLIVVLFAGIYLWRMFITSKGKARRRLARLQQQNTNSSETDSNTVYQIADIIKDGLGLSRLSAKKILPMSGERQSQSWLSFVQHLDSARYSSEPFSREELKQLMLDAKRWLK